MTQKNYTDFSNFVKGKRFALIGIGVSNLPLVSFLLNAGAKEITVRDLKKAQDDINVVKAKADGAKIILGNSYLEDLNEDVILRSPGIRPDISEFLNAAKNYNSLITTETELFLKFAPCKTVAVTGSDGKTTTTTLISEILKAEGYHVILGGNIGKSMLSQLKECYQENSIAVMELSSFQLMNCQNSPNISVITNLAENHLDWHQDMNEYLIAKQNIFKHHNLSDIAVFNANNIHTSVLSSPGIYRQFSYGSEPKTSGVYFKNGVIYHYENQISTPVLNSSDIILPGKHNIENFMAAICAVFDLVSQKSIEKVAKNFKGVAHRIEWIRKLHGVTYYNSSIDSSPSRSTACLRSFKKPIIMIAGGYDKKLDYTNLGKEICEHVKVLILCGATSTKIKTAVELAGQTLKMPRIIECNDFSKLASIAQNEATEGDNVVLSPASASFDMFRNFEERGNLFKKYVMELV